MISRNQWVCPKCGGDLKYYSTVKRIVKSKGGIKKNVLVKRFRCMKCFSVHRQLPPNLLPYKHYEAEIIRGVIRGDITPYNLEYEDYPCETTMNRWMASQKLQILLWRNGYI